MDVSVTVAVLWAWFSKASTTETVTLNPFFGTGELTGLNFSLLAAAAEISTGTDSGAPRPVAVKGLDPDLLSP